MTCSPRRKKRKGEGSDSKTSITQRLRTDLGRSVGVTTATQLVWLSRFHDPNIPTNRKSCVIKRRPGSYYYCEDEDWLSSSQTFEEQTVQYSMNKRKIIYKAMDEMTKAKVIGRSQSPRFFSFVVVKKKDESDRIYANFRKLNKIVRPVHQFLTPSFDWWHLVTSWRRKILHRLGLEVEILASATWGG